MPVLLREGPYRFFFYSADWVEPPHVHVRRDRHTAKFWLDPVSLASSGGMRSAEVRRLQRIVEENQASFLRDWNAHFSD